VITRGCTGLISWPYVRTSRLIRKARIRLRGAWHTGKADLRSPSCRPSSQWLALHPICDLRDTHRGSSNRTRIPCEQYVTSFAQ
jgi:hypothetical protein